MEKPHVNTRVTTLQVSHVMGSKYTHKLTHADTQTQTHRHTDKQTHRHTETQTHRHTVTETQRHRHLSRACWVLATTPMTMKYLNQLSDIRAVYWVVRRAHASYSVFVPLYLVNWGVYFGGIYLRPAKNRRRLAVLACATKRLLAHC
jgi:hypothetical protein